jgi:hypothetical protein
MRTKNLTLTTKEKREEIFVTIGRLKTAIKAGSPEERLLALLEKISNDISNIDVRLMHFVSKIGEKDIL